MPRVLLGAFFMDTQDIFYMKRAINLASKGLGWVNPNPLVGAVVVKNNQIIGEGWHERFGGPHAERNAFKNCTEDARGADLYVTLEPCCHFGKTPPCTEAVISHGIKRVFVGIEDPNPLVSGKGISILREAGIEVTVGICRDDIIKQNRVFLKYITTGFPWVMLKYAMTMDGKIASYMGDSKWVTGEAARAMVHRLRAENMAVALGIGSVKADNPLLNCRLEGSFRQPVRLIVDSRASIAECIDSSVTAGNKLIFSAKQYRTIVAHTADAPAQRLAELKDAGVETLLCDGVPEHGGVSGGRVDVKDMLLKIGKLGIDSVMVEGGGNLNASLVEGGCVDEVIAFVAPKIIGGHNAVSPIEGAGIDLMRNALQLRDVVSGIVGDDFYIRGILKK
jgi:diaminohydroxyphosphoribosylaminopyrimidine deaminase/5-amino-6-(5-phosphoribosylamino)uracil reductase